MIYWQLFLSFLQVGLFSFGGGYASLGLIQAEVVEVHGWISMTEFTDLITISQMTPGPIAVNAATFVGVKIAGIGGGLVATLGAVAPSILIVTLLAWLYNKYQNLESLQTVLLTLRPAVIAMILASGVTILVGALWPSGLPTLTGTSWVALLIFGVCLYLIMKHGLDPIQAMVLAGLLNVLMSGLIK